MREARGGFRRVTEAFASLAAMAWGERAPRRAAWLLMAMSFAIGSPARATDTALPRRLFDALAVEAELAAIVPIATGHLARAPATPASDRLVLRDIVERGFAPDRLEAQAFEAFLAGFDLTRAREADRWLAQPATRRLYAASRAPAVDCPQADAAPAAPRARAIERIDAAIGQEARARRHASRVFAAMLRAANRAMPEMRRYSRVELEGLIEAHRAGLGKASPVCRYCDIPTEELLAAQAFLDGEAGRWLYRGVSAAIERSLARAARATALRIVDAFQDDAPRPRLRVAGLARRG